MKNLKAYCIIFLAIIITSCSDDPEPDVRNQAEGTYNYQQKYYILDGASLIHISDLDDSGTMIVSKSSSGLEIKEGGEIIFIASKIAKASNGFTFDVETQTITDDGLTLTIEGYDKFELNSVKYHGGYNSSAKKLEAYFQTEILVEDENGDIYEADIVIEIKATKV